MSDCNELPFGNTVCGSPMERVTENGADYWMDARGNRVRVMRDHGSVILAVTYEQALSELRSLKDCYGCYDCMDCTGCTGCLRSAGCTGCTGCMRCVDCVRCDNCVDCRGCVDCHWCVSSFGCSSCHSLKDCGDCRHECGKSELHGTAGDWDFGSMDPGDSVSDRNGRSAEELAECLRELGGVLASVTLPYADYFDARKCPSDRYGMAVRGIRDMIGGIRDDSGSVGSLLKVSRRLLEGKEHEQGQEE